MKPLQIPRWKLPKITQQIFISKLHPYSLSKNPKQLIVSAKILKLVLLILISPNIRVTESVDYSTILYITMGENPCKNVTVVRSLVKDMCKYHYNNMALIIGRYFANSISNKIMHATYGNRQSTLKLVTWNKGSSQLQDSLDKISQIINDLQPDVISLQEANLKQHVPLHSVSIQGYTLYTDSLYYHGLTARTVVYVKSDINASVLSEYMRPEISVVPLLLTNRKSKIQLLSFYRQWSIEPTDNYTRLVSGQVSEQQKRFHSICQIWAEMVDRNIETLSLSDTNLSLPLLIENESEITRYDEGLRPIAKHFSEMMIPRGVIVLNNSHTHYSYSSKTESCLDHITTNHPGNITTVKTIDQISSDHKLILVIRKVSQSYSIPRYRYRRNWNKIDRLSMAWDINLNPLIRQARVSPDPTQTAALIQEGLLMVLEKHAPQMVSQVKSTNTMTITTQTRALQYQAKHLKSLAKRTGNQLIWRNFRQIRNQASKSLKADLKHQAQLRLDGKNIRNMWNEVKKVTGLNQSGPPKSLISSGILVSAPQKVAEILNQFYRKNQKNTGYTRPP